MAPRLALWPFTLLARLSFGITTKPRACGQVSRIDKYPQPQLSDVTKGNTKAMLPPIKHYPDALIEGGVMHFLITPEKGQFEQLGQTLDERLKAFKKLICKTAQALLFDLKSVELQ